MNNLERVRSQTYGNDLICKAEPLVPLLSGVAMATALGCILELSRKAPNYRRRVIAGTALTPSLFTVALLIEMTSRRCRKF